MTENQQLWKNILQYGGAGASTVGGILAATGYGSIPGLILMGAGAGMTAGSTAIKDKITPIPEDITATVMMSRGGVLGDPNFNVSTTPPLPENYGINDWLSGIDIPRLPNKVEFYNRNTTEMGKAFGSKTKDVTQQPTNKTTQPQGYASMLEKANKTNTISAIAQGVMGGISLLQELQAEKSTDLNTPTINDVKLDKDQSSFLNAMDMSMALSNAAQTRMAKDMGIDPGVLATSMYAMSNLQKMQILSQADKTRNDITMQQENINNQRKQLAVQSKLQADQFNISKQVSENQESSKNLSSAIAAMISAYPMKQQMDFSNQLAIERLAKGIY